MAKILDGKWLASQVKENICKQVQAELAAGRRAPGLGVILVGDNPASKVYVANKGKFAKECYFKTVDINLPANASQKEVALAVSTLNNNWDIDGILLQLPLPSGLKAEPLLSFIKADKDADGLHPLNQGLLMRNEGELRPCTPSGSMMLIDLALSKFTSHDPTFSLEALPKATLAGKRAVVIGRSVLVGKPIGLMLLERNATVTYAHSKTENLAGVCREADILVAAVGQEHLVKGDWIKPGAVVIDVGMNRTKEGKLTGDVDFAEAEKVASAITPVPGGVGPLTIAMLIKNTLQSYLEREKLRELSYSPIKDNTAVEAALRKLKQEEQWIASYQLSSGRLAVFKIPQVVKSPHHFLLYFPECQGEPSPQEREEMLTLSNSIGREQGERLYKNPEAYSILHNGNAPSSVPEIHFHIFALADILAKETLYRVLASMTPTYELHHKGEGIRN